MVTNLVPGTQYQFQVAVKSGCSELTYSDKVEVSTQFDGKTTFFYFLIYSVLSELYLIWNSVLSELCLIWNSVLSELCLIWNTVYMYFKETTCDNCLPEQHTQSD